MGGQIDWRTGWFDWRRKRFWAWVLFAAYTFVGFVIVPWALRGVIVEAVQDRLGLPARLEDVDLNPLALSGRLEKFRIDDTNGAPLVRFDELYVNFELSSVFRRAWTFRGIRITNPFVRVERETSGAVNLVSLVPPGPEDETPGALRLVVQQFEMIGGRADVIDRAATQPFETRLGPVDVAVRDFSTLPDDAGQQTVTIETESGGRVEWAGTLGLTPLRSEGSATITSLPLTKLTAYVPDGVGVAIVEGTSDVSFRYELAGSPDGLAAKVHGLVWSLDGVRVVARLPHEAQTGQPDATPPADLLSFASLRFAGGELGWPARTLAFEEVSLTKPDLRLWRESDNRLVWEQLAPTGEEVALEADVAVESADSVVPVAAGPAPGESGGLAHQTPWNVAVARVSVNGGSVHFEDRALSPPSTVTLTGIDASVEAVSLENDAEFPIALGFDVEGGGAFELEGVLTVFPVLRFSGRTRVGGLSLPLVQPYIAAATYAELESGTLDLAGTLTSTPEETLVYQGNLEVDDLAVVLAETRTRLVAWKRFSLDVIDLDVDAAEVEITSVEFEEPYARLHIAKDGTLNVDRLFRSVDATAESADDAVEAQPGPALAADSAAGSGETGPWAVKVGKLRILNGGTEYQDENLPIPFAILVHHLSGEMSSLDTTSRTPASLALEGEVGEYGLVRIEAALQPLAFTRNTTFDAHFENIALPEASPYSIRFAGHRIASGKLDLDTHYRIENEHLKGSHDIVLRDFALGEKVEYPDAFDLPYGLLISLLKGPDGNIDVELPVEGDVDDPEFRLGGVIVKALFGLLTKIVTSPFRLLGSLVGMGDSEEFDKVAFLPGRSELAAPEREKVAKLAMALVQRPQLTLQVPGIVDPVADGAAAREAQVNARIEAAVAGGDQVVRRRVLEEMYRAGNPNEPIEGLVQRFTSVPAEGGEGVLDELAYLAEMQRWLIEVEAVAPDALADLGAARSASVRDGVLAGAELDPARITTTATQEVKLNDAGVVMMTLGVDAG